MTHRLHDAVSRHLIELPQDYVPYGGTERDAHLDCSCGCAHWHPLTGDLGMDWGVCGCPESHRYGLLTFEHQGCPVFEEAADPENPVHCADCGRGLVFVTIESSEATVQLLETTLQDANGSGFPKVDGRSLCPACAMGARIASPQKP